LRLLRKHREDQPAASAEPTTQCEHVTLIPSWDRAEDIGDVDRVSLYRCEACRAEFTLEEAEHLRATEEARLRRRMAG
jgi:hypothetical protein